MPDFVGRLTAGWQDGERLVAKLGEIYSEFPPKPYRLAILEGADLKELRWRNGGKVRAL